MHTEVVWDGRGELTEWPAVDWYVVLRDETWQPIWDQQPQTTGLVWTRLMGSRHYDPHDDHRSFLRTRPSLIDTDRLRDLEAVWVQGLKRIGMLGTTSPSAPTEAPKPTIAQPTPQSSDVALAELHAVEQSLTAIGRNDVVKLCATTNKVKHSSKLWALHHRNRLAMSPDEEHPERLEAYKCRWCGGWHVGHRAA